MLKTCCLCRAQKLGTDFNRDRKRRDGRQNVCRECSSMRSRLYYQNHTEAHREVTKKRRNEQRRLFKQRTDAIKQRFGCRVCGESDVVCLDFHHLDPSTKEFDIAAAMSAEWPWEKVPAEIRKCACLCANGDRKAH